jgi:hypothetical protein
MLTSQFTVYLLFAIIWPCLFAAVYAVLERALPRFLIVDHSDE